MEIEETESEKIESKRKAIKWREKMESKKKGGHIYGKNEGWAYLRKLLYRTIL